jgi:hypothetical protein
MLVAAGALVVTFVGGATAAGAQSDYVGTRPATVTRDPVRPADPEAKVLGRVVTRAPIPITGGDVAGLAMIGAGAIGTGTLLLRRGRRAPR